MRYNKYTNLILEEVRSEIDVNLKVKRLRLIKEQINKTGHDLSDMIDRLTKNMLKCPHCSKYFEPKSVDSGIKRETVRGVCVYTDCGYGDDDLYADVTYDVLFKKCPFCKKDVETYRYEVSESNRSDRWGDRR